MADAIRTAAREGVLSGPAITFAIAEEINLLKQEPEWISGTRNSVTVVKTSNLSIVLTAIKKGATLCGHEVDGPITPQLEHQPAFQAMHSNYNHDREQAGR